MKGVDAETPIRKYAEGLAGKLRHRGQGEHPAF